MFPICNKIAPLLKISFSSFNRTVHCIYELFVVVAISNTSTVACTCASILSNKIRRILKIFMSRKLCCFNYAMQVTTTIQICVLFTLKYMFFITYWYHVWLKISNNHQVYDFCAVLSCGCAVVWLCCCVVELWSD